MIANDMLDRQKADCGSLLLGFGVAANLPSHWCDCCLRHCLPAEPRKPCNNWSLQSELSLAPLSACSTRTEQPWSIAGSY